MIRNHPEWVGFSQQVWSSPFGFREDREVFREAFVLATTNQRDSKVLHNAAMYFALREPRRSVALLERSRLMDPSEELYREQLGAVYAHALGLDPRIGLAGSIEETPDRRALAEEAGKLLAKTSDSLMIAGALSAFRYGAAAKRTDWMPILERRYRELNPSGEWSRDLPSERRRYNRPECTPGQ